MLRHVFCFAGLNTTLTSVPESKVVLCKSQVSALQSVFHEISIAMITTGERQSKYRGFVLGYITYDYGELMLCENLKAFGSK